MATEDMPCPDCGRGDCTGEDCYLPGEAFLFRDDGQPIGSFGWDE
jgi:hypothetical protein